MYSSYLKLPISLFLIVGISVGICYGKTGDSGSSPHLDLDLQNREYGTEGQVIHAIEPFSLGDILGLRSDTKGQKEATVLKRSTVRVKRGGGYGYGYSGYGGYGGYGGQWTGHCCNYGHNISPGCQYNGFWNARNNPYCY